MSGALIGVSVGVEMKYLYWNRYVIYGNKKYLLEWSDGEPYLEDYETKKKILIKMHNISKFSWIKNKIEYTLKIDRSSRKKSKQQAFERGKYVDVEECNCTISTKKL